MKRNYQKEMEKQINEAMQKEEVPRLLLHSCCAPCSSYVLEYLSGFFEITVYYYNPNITDPQEYRKRVLEQERLTKEMQARHKILFEEGPYEPECFFEAAKGMEQLPEGGDRCRACFALRLKKTAQAASEGGFGFFTTTLSISPLKNAQALNELGELAAAEYGNTRFLNADFKKKEGYKRSLELSKQYGLYRQDFCGCIFSEQERNNRKNKEE